MFNLIIALAAASAVFMIVFGGFQYMTTDSWQGKSAGLDKARNAVYGLLLVLASYLILRTIDPRLVAIPTTLVAPLNTDYSKINSASDLLNSVATYADQSSAVSKKADQQSTAAKQTVDGIKAKIDAADNELNNLQNLANGPLDLTKIVAKETEIADLQKQLSAATSVQTAAFANSEYARRANDSISALQNAVQTNNNQSTVTKNVAVASVVSCITPIGSCLGSLTDVAGSLITKYTTSAGTDTQITYAESQRQQIITNYNSTVANLRQSGADVTTINDLTTQTQSSVKSIESAVSSALGCPNNYAVGMDSSGGQHILCKK